MQIPEEFTVLYPRWLRGEISAATGGKLLGVSHVTFLKWAKARQAEDSED